MNRTTIKAFFKRAQKTRVIYSLLTALLLLSLASCGQNKIVNRWVPAGSLNKGILEVKTNHGKAVEFLQNGTFNIYDEGNIEGSGTYKMASDSRSILVKDGRQSGTFKIIKLTSSELIMISTQAYDTIVYYPSGSSASKEAETKAINYNTLQKNWGNLAVACERRRNYVANQVRRAETLVDRNDEIFTRLSATQNEIDAYRFDIRIPSKEGFTNYMALQNKFSKDIADFTAFLKKNPKVDEMVNHNYMPPPIGADPNKKDDDPLLICEKNIAKSKSEFITAFNKYHGKQIL